MTYDGYAGQVVVYVNGVSQGVCFSGLSSATLYPAIATYSANRAGCLLRAEEVAELPVIAPPAASAGAGASGGGAAGLCFDRARCGPGGVLEFSEGDTVARSSSSTNAMAVVNRGFGAVKATWEFRVVHEESNNEVRRRRASWVLPTWQCHIHFISSLICAQGSVFGASFSVPPSTFDYTNNEGGVYLRCYNGAW